MRILVTGASGQMGQQLKSMEVQWPEIAFDFVDSKQLDITKEQQVLGRLSSQRIDVVINFAAFTQVDLAETQQEKAFEVNAKAVAYLAQACLDNNIILVHLSTDFVFDGLKNTPYLIKDTPNPINAYGNTKLKGERFLQGILPQHYIVRTSWIYSEFGNNFKKTMLKLAGFGKPINVVNDQIGCPTHAKDICEFIMGLVLNKQPFGLYHFSGDNICSWYDFAVTIFEENKLVVAINPIESSQYPQIAKRPKYSVIK